PRLMVATEKAAELCALGSSRMPSLDAVALSATISGAPAEAERRSELIPGRDGAGSVFVQVKFSAMSVAGRIAVGVNAITKDWLEPGAMLTGTLGKPVTWFVAEFVVW